MKSTSIVKAKIVPMHCQLVTERIFEALAFKGPSSWFSVQKECAVINAASISPHIWSKQILLDVVTYGSDEIECAKIDMPRHTWIAGVLEDSCPTLSDH
jgi:hypothetical protein